MAAPQRTYRIAVIPGDGIGKEVVPEGVKALSAAARRFGFTLSYEHFDFSSWEYYDRHGRMLPEDWKQILGRFDAIYFGAVGWPDRVPDHVSLWGSLLEFRRGFEQYINLRPIRVLTEESPVLKDRPARDVDFLILRENTEGEYSSVGGRMYAGTDREIAIQETVMSRVGVDRVVRYAFELAARRPRKRLMSATKSNGISIAMPFWDERVEQAAADFPQVEWAKAHIDILAANFVLHPDHFDVVVASNLFGDILSDLGAACAGTIGIAPSGNINPERAYPSLFEPVHGSAPDIFGKSIANPVGQIWAGAMMLDHLGETEAAEAIVKAIQQVMADPGLRTADLGGAASTGKCGAAIAAAIR